MSDRAGLQKVAKDEGANIDKGNTLCFTSRWKLYSVDRCQFHAANIKQRTTDEALISETWWIVTTPMNANVPSCTNLSCCRNGLVHTWTTSGWGSRWCSRPFKSKVMLKHVLCHNGFAYIWTLYVCFSQRDEPSCNIPLQGLYLKYFETSVINNVNSCT